MLKVPKKSLDNLQQSTYPFANKVKGKSTVTLNTRTFWVHNL